MMNNSELERIMQLLNIKEVTTKRQKKNGTREFELPIKNQYGGKKIRVASFESGYVRRQNGAHTAYQLNKRCDSEPQYYPITSPIDGDTQYRKYTTRSCVLIPNEQVRLNYLISYCLKNYYIGQANLVPNNEYIPKWEHEYEINNLRDRMEASEYEAKDVQVIIDGHRYKVI